MLNLTSRPSQALESNCDRISRICIHDEAVKESRLRAHRAEASRDAQRCHERRKLLQRGGHLRNVQALRSVDGESAPEAGQGRLGCRAAWFSGGYALARDAAHISALDVIRAIDGPLFITSCVTSHGTCDLTTTCSIREPLRRVNDSILEVLEKVKISHMTDESPLHEVVELRV